MDKLTIDLDGLTKAEGQLTDIDAMFFLLSYLGMSPAEIQRQIESGQTVEQVLKLYEVKKQEQKRQFLDKGMADPEAETKADEAVNFVSILKLKSDSAHRASIARQLLEIFDFSPEVIFFKNAGEVEVVKILIDLESFTKLVTAVGQFAAKRYDVKPHDQSDRSLPQTEEPTPQNQSDRIASLQAEIARLKTADSMKSVQATSTARSLEEMGMG